MNRRFSFSEGEWYHCYSRGIDKRVVFDEEKDATRFIELLYLANDVAPVRRDDVGQTVEIFSRKRDPIVAVVAYVLMPNHYHLVLREITEGGISRFMQKLGTAYTMYYNAKYERVGNLFTRPFRAKHLKDDQYMQHAVRYVHMNPCELFEPEWKKGKVRNIAQLAKSLKGYANSSLIDFEGGRRPQASILNRDSKTFLRTEVTSVMLAEAAEYYAETSLDDLHLP